MLIWPTCWCTNADDLKIVAVGIDPSGELKTTNVLCLLLMTEGLSMLLTLAGELVGVSPEWNRILDVPAIMPFTPETVVKGWSFSGARSARGTAASTPSCLSSCLPLLGVLVFQYIETEESWALPDLACEIHRFSHILCAK